MIQGKVADFVATFSVGIFQYVSIVGHDAAITNRRLEMVLKGFIHYIPQGKGDTGHYVTFLYYNMGSWVVIDDHQVFIVTDTFAHYFAPLARIFVYEHVPEGSSLPQDSFFKERWEMYYRQLEFLVTIHHMIFSGRKRKIPTKGSLVSYLSPLVIGPEAYVKLFISNFYSSRLEMNDRGKSFADKMKELYVQDAKDVLTSFARARVPRCKDVVKKMTSSMGTNWLLGLDKTPPKNSRAYRHGARSHSNRIRVMILTDIMDSFLIPSEDHTLQYSAEIIELVDAVVEDYLETSSVPSPKPSNTIVISSPPKKSMSEDGVSTTPEIISLASSDDEDASSSLESTLKVTRLSCHFKSAGWDKKFAEQEPTAPSTNMLNRQLLGCEQLWLLVLKFISDGCLSLERDGPLISYSLDLGVFWTNRAANGEINYSAIERIFKDQFLTGDQGSQYIKLLQIRQLALERQSTEHPKILFIDSFLLPYLENGFVEKASKMVKKLVRGRRHLKEYDQIMILCNVGNYHYFWVKVNGRSEQHGVQCYDSIADEGRKFKLRPLVRFLRTELELGKNPETQKNFLNVTLMPCPR